MAGGRRAGTSLAIAKLPQLAPYGPGPYILHWLGQLKATTSPDAPTGLDMTAHFLGLEGAQHQHVNVDLPLSALPSLRLGMIWRNGASMGPPRGAVTQVTVDMARFDRVQHAVIDPVTVLPRKVYAVAGIPNRCWCRLVPLDDGSELIVPTFELLRAMYFLHPAFIPAFVGGAIDDPELVSPGLMPWFPDETRRLSADEVQIAFPRRISGELASVLASILFSPPAADGLSYLARFFRKAKLTERAFKFPPIAPPLTGKGRWTIRYIWLHPYRGAPARRLVLSIDETDHPLTYTKIHPVTPDNYSTPMRNDELPAYRHQAARVELPSDGALNLYASAPDTRLQKVNFAELTIVSNATKVEIVKELKETQSHRSLGGAAGDPVLVDGVAADGAGLPVEGRPGVATTSGKSHPTSEATEQLKMRLVFEEVRDRLIGSTGMKGWTVEFLGRSGVIKVINPDRRHQRAYLILHIFHAYRHIYMIEAQKLNEWDRFPVLICQRPQGEEISFDEFTQWLGGFPYEPGRRWLDPSAEGLLLLPARSKHQPRKGGMSIDDVHRQFVRRLAVHVERFVEDPYWQYRKGNRGALDSD